MQKVSQEDTQGNRFSDADLRQRLSLLDFRPEDAQALQLFLPAMEEAVDEIVDEFYRHQMSIPAIADVIGQPTVFSRLKESMRSYLLELFSGNYDLDYVTSRMILGHVHNRLDVEPKLYLAGVSKLKAILKARIKASEKETDIKKKIYHALDKLFFFDTTLVFDSYINGLLQELRSAQEKIKEHSEELEIKVLERTQELEELAREDPLTGLSNQRVLFEVLPRDLLRAERMQTPLTLIYFDVDNFKTINDSKGHLSGDKTLKNVAKAVQSACREVDIMCRYGGDEFCIILPECNAAQAECVATRIIDHFSRFQPDVTFSMGIAQTGPENYKTAADLVKCADMMMYEAKKKPGFQVRLYKQYKENKIEH